MKLRTFWAIWGGGGSTSLDPPMQIYPIFEFLVITGRNEVVAKVMFLQACVCPQGWRGFCLSAYWDTPPRTRHTTTLPRDQADPPGPGRHTPPGPGRPPRTRQTPRKADSSRRSTSGRYASYWNAFLLLSRL